MVTWKHERLRGKSLEEMVEALGTLEAGEVGSPAFEMYRAAIQAELAEQIAAPRRWAAVAAIAAAISAAATVVALIIAI
jgi:hypothetical protein